jgi:hypothetical protein
MTISKKATDFKNQWLSNWWAHQDLNLGPKDYEQLQEIKTFLKSIGYKRSTVVWKQMWKLSCQK